MKMTLIVCCLEKKLVRHGSLSTPRVNRKVYMKTNNDKVRTVITPLMSKKNDIQSHIIPGHKKRYIIINFQMTRKIEQL
jgi:hypothetical protein